jgi:hypothetical protein
MFKTFGTSKKYPAHDDVILNGEIHFELQKLKHEPLFFYGMISYNRCLCYALYVLKNAIE